MSAHRAVALPPMDRGERLDIEGAKRFWTEWEDNDAAWTLLTPGRQRQLAALLAQHVTAQRWVI